MKPEQLDNDCCSKCGNGYKAFIKRETRRERRRVEKKLLDNAPKKNVYAGWS